MQIVRQSALVTFGYKLNVTNCLMINNHDIGWELRNAEVVINNLTWVNWTGTPLTHSFTVTFPSLEASLVLSNSVLSYITYIFHFIF